MRMREKWTIVGCTIVSDGWLDTKNRPTINVMPTSTFDCVYEIC